MAQIILHIGLHKTGTTTLQKQFFPVCHELNYLSESYNEVNKFVQAATVTDPIYYDEINARKLIEPYISENKPNLISRESFSGSPYAGLMKAGLDHRHSILINLKATLPEAKVIIVIRRQDTLARSLYRQYIKTGGTESISSFYGFTGKRSPLLSLNRFHFSPYIDELMFSFPAGVLILVFEEFVSNQSHYLNKLVKFIGVDIPSVDLYPTNKTSLGYIGLEISRIIGRFFNSQLNPGGLIPQIPSYRNGKLMRINPMSIIHDRWPIKGKSNKKCQFYLVSENILSRFHEDNFILDKKYNLGLDKYGYY